MTNTVPAAAHFDLLLRGAMTLDGTGSTPLVRADVGISGDKIAAVGDLAHARAGRIIDLAPGRVVCPGFVDIHTHSDTSLLYTPGMESSLAQGVTCEIVGNCGFSLGLARPAPDALFSEERRRLERGGVVLDWNDMAGFFRRVENDGIALHVASLVGHGTLRKRVMGVAERAPEAAELTQMQRELARALEAGAVGLSSGLEYVPGMYAGVDELAALARVAKEHGTLYATHLRDEGDFLEQAVEEALAVAEASGVRLQLSHHKAEKPRNWGKIARTLQNIDDARARGVDVGLDQYPYTAYQTNLATIALPPWANAATPAALAEKLRDPDLRTRVRLAMNDDGIDYAAVEIASYAPEPFLVGRTVAELALETGQNARDWLLDFFGRGDAFSSAVHHALSETDVERVLSDPRVAIGSDAVAASPTGPTSGDKTHPRSYGTFARVLARYVRERGLLSLPEAVRRMTSLPAERIGLTDRGRLAPGFVADITVFDPATITETATFADPHRLAVGIEYVVVAGTLAWANGVATGARAGRVLRGTRSDTSNTTSGATVQGVRGSSGAF